MPKNRVQTDAIMTLSLTKAQLAQLNQGNSCLCLMPQEADFENPEIARDSMFKPDESEIKDEPVSSDVPPSDSPEGVGYDMSLNGF